jgi:broad specificity phosphatase PhoE
MDGARSSKLPTAARDGRYGRPEDAGAEETARIVLVRHGESRCALDGVVGGPRGCTGLSTTGTHQVHQLGRRLARSAELGPVSRLYSSVLARAVETADVLAPYLGHPERAEDCDLCELHPGACDAMTWAGYREAFGGVDFSVDPHTPLSPGGESWSGFLLRVRGALSRLADAHRGETVVVAGHGGLIDGSLAVFLGVADRGRALDLRTRYASLTEWRVAGGRWRLVRYNDGAHLEGGWTADGEPSPAATQVGGPLTPPTIEQASSTAQQA